MTVGQYLGGVRNYCLARKDSIQSVLPKGYTAERFITSSLMYLRLKPDLWKVSPETFYAEALKVAQQGLDLGMPNEAHLVPFKDKCQMVRGYKGDLKMARRNPNIKFIDANAVRENDEFEADLGNDILTHKLPKLGKDRGAIVGFYCKARDINGALYLFVIDNAEAWRHAKRFTKAFKNGPFAGIVDKGPGAENWEPYGLKTAIHLCCGRKLDLYSDMGLEDEAAVMRGEARIDDVLGDDVTDATPIQQATVVESTTVEAGAGEEQGEEDQEEEVESPIEGQQSADDEPDPAEDYVRE